MKRYCPVCGKGFSTSSQRKAHTTGSEKCLAAARHRAQSYPVRHGPRAWADARSFVAIGGERIADWVGVDEKGRAWLAFKP